MKPIHALIFQLSRIPIAVLLIIIVVVAGGVSIAVTGILNEQIKLADIQRIQLNQIANAKGKVVYALKDVAEGQEVSGDALEERDILQSKIPQDAIVSPSLAIGQIAKYGITAGTIVSQHDLAPQGISLGFDAKLKPGMRAVTFGVDNNSGVAGFVNPDSRVDIIAMVGTGAETKVAPILSDVEVIAVGQLYQKSSGQSTAMPSSSVTVSVSPQDTNKLIKAISASKLYLALRNGKDHTPVATVDVTSMFPGANSGNNLAIVPPPPKDLPLPPLPNLSEVETNQVAAPPKAPAYEIEVWKSNAKDIITFPAAK